MGINHFKIIFKTYKRVTITEILILSQSFPRFTNHEDRALMEEIIEEELKGILHNFKKDKSPGPYGWKIEFFLSLYDIIIQDLLQLVEETRKNGVMHPLIKTTFITLIPKTDHPSLIEEFIPISLFTITYKVIAKL